MLRTLRDIYAVRQGLLLRVFPNDFEDGTGVMRSILAEEGFGKDQSVGWRGTALIDLSYSLDELRKSLKRQWKQNLKMAERNQLEIIEGVDDDLAEVFLRLYREMRRRKDSPQIPNVAYFRDVQRDLPDPLKMSILICKHLGDPVAGLVVSPMGFRALAMFAATGDKGLDLRGSYLLQWRMLEALKAKNVRWYNLGGINHKAYPGTSQFKAGLAGELGWEVEYVGQFQACESTINNLLVKMGEQLRATYGVVKWRVSRGRWS
jgi:lipid II:glycine glycyltransferase (peptidoglycan interpeptide bridge formation enzyme)